MITLPVHNRTSFCDGLWRHTCAELFVAEPDKPRYCEFNFSPSTQWAAYTFDDYRVGMRPLDTASPSIEVERHADQLIMRVRCELPTFVAESALLRCGLSLVVEDHAGVISYWALAHPADKPDFHHRAGFVLEL